MRTTRRLLSDAAGSCDQTQPVASTSSLPGRLDCSKAVVASAAVSSLHAAGALGADDVARDPTAVNRVAEIEAKSSPEVAIETIRCRVGMGGIRVGGRRSSNSVIPAPLQQASARSAPFVHRWRWLYWSTRESHKWRSLTWTTSARRPLALPFECRSPNR